MTRTSVTEVLKENKHEEEVEEYTPTYLNKQDVRSLYQQALAQAEVNICNAWLNLLLNTEDKVKLTLYYQAKERLSLLEKDMQRVLL